MSNGLSLRELGRRTGVTASLLSQIENGKSDPSVSTLSALVSELGLSLDALLRSEWPTALDDGPVPLAGASLNGTGSLNGTLSPDGARAGDGTAPHSDSGPPSDLGARNGLTGRGDEVPVGGTPNRGDSPVIRPPERQTLDLDSGVVWERLTRGPSELLDVLLVTYEPGATSSSGGKLLRHSGTEHAYLMSGELTLQLGFETFRLGAGDSLEFDGATPHVYCNPGDVPARGLWFVLGRDTPAVQPRPHRLLELAESGPHSHLSVLDLLRVTGAPPGGR